MFNFHALHNDQYILDIMSRNTHSEYIMGNEKIQPLIFTITLYSSGKNINTQKRIITRTNENSGGNPENNSLSMLTDHFRAFCLIYF